MHSYKLMKKKSNRIILGTVLFFFLCSVLFFNFLGFERRYVDILTKICAVCLFFYIVIFPWKKNRMHFHYLVLGMVLVPMLSFIPCYFENGQMFLSSFSAYSFFFLIFVYFLCHEGTITEKDLVKWITILAVLRTLILIIQQFTYPNYWFSFRPEGYISQTGTFRTMEVRSGIYRFYIEDTFLSMFLVFYYADKLTHSFKTTYILLFFYGLLGVYLDQSRQFMTSTLAALLFVLLSSKMKYKYKYTLLSIITIALMVVYFNFDYLFGNLINKTEDDLSEDYIRFASYNHYLYDAWGGPLSFIFGNGPIGDSVYGKISQYYEQEIRFFHSDVGIVGALHLFGIVTVLYLIYAYYSILRKWKLLDDHIKMYFIGTLFNIPFICLYTQRPGYMVFWAFMIYLADLSISRKKTLLKSY